MRTMKFKIISGVLLLLILTLLFGIVLYRSYLKINHSLYEDEKQVKFDAARRTAERLVKLNEDLPRIGAAIPQIIGEPSYLGIRSFGNVLGMGTIELTIRALRGSGLLRCRCGAFSRDSGAF